MVNAVADLFGRVWGGLRTQSAVARFPRLADVVGAKRARRGGRDEDSAGVAGVENDGGQTHAACARLPLRARAVAAQSGEFLPVLAAIGRAEQGGVFDSSVDRVGIGERRLQMPHAFKFPGTLGAVVPLMSGERLAGFRGRGVDELVACGLRGTWGGRFSGRRSGLVPGFAAVVGALNQLSEPSAGLRSVDAIGIGGRSFQVIHLPAPA